MDAAWVLSLSLSAASGPAASVVKAFDLPRSGLALARPPLPGAFFDVVGRRAALFGYEGRGFEAWAYPLKLLDELRLSFRIEGYPLEFEAASLLAGVEVRPEATLFTYSHAAFTVRQVLFAPLEEPGLVMLLDVRSALPLSVFASFRPRLKLMWPADLMTGDASWDEESGSYTIGEESQRFAAVVGSPGARDVALMPYQEEPRDVPLRFVVDVPLEAMRRSFVPIVIAGSVQGKDEARAVYRRLLAGAQDHYAAVVALYRALQERTLELATPDARLDAAFAWAKVGLNKGLASNPLLGTDLIAGFRASGESERPGFGWFFGRDALWSALALHSSGDFPAALLPWFSDYPYPWNAADATPLYVVAHADHWRASGDRSFLEASWDSILRAYRFTAASDGDGNGLVENTKFGHGCVEGGPLHPAHEEIYQQGVWIAACEGLAEPAETLGQQPLAAEARAAGRRTRAAVETTYWIAARGHYGFATTGPPEKPPVAEPGPNRARRQARMDEQKDAGFVDEDTVLPAVPLWWKALDPARVQSQIDRLWAAALANDRGQRLLSNASRLYDPLSHHSGSVWPLFTGWAALAAYRHGRPHVGYQALMANALLTEPGALGYVTELLSGDYNAPSGARRTIRSGPRRCW